MPPAYNITDHSYDVVVVGAVVEVVVAAPAPVVPITASKGPETMTAAPARTILLG